MSSHSQLLRQGAFPQQIDPWAEQGRYFHQLHGHMIGYILDQITDVLMERGYRIGREASLQISENSFPDIVIQGNKDAKKLWDYPQAIASSSLEVGVVLNDDTELDLDALYIRQAKSSKLVTVLEIVSPRNKSDFEGILAYQARRRILKLQGVHVVEIDFTRSHKRLIDDKIAREFPYHIAIHLHDQSSRFLPMKLDDAPKSFGLPLHADFVAVEMLPVYRQAYEKLAIAWQIEDEGRYRQDDLPFPSSLSEAQIEILLKALQVWRSALKAAMLE